MSPSADTFILLIGQDTHMKTVFVKDGVDVAVEKGYRLIGMNLNDCRFRDICCPEFFGGKGALFIPYSSRIAKEPLQSGRRQPSPPSNTSDWYFYDYVYRNGGYALVNDTAVLPERPNPFANGNMPSWAK